MTTRGYILAALSLLAVQALVLFSFGQPAICTCGSVKFWEGVVTSAGNSQHLFDWYTFSHIIHGFIFYGLLRFASPQMKAWQRLVIAVGIEAGWEILENTSTVIEHYREQALAQGYTGDSIINSVSDTLSMAAGFLLARRLPVWLIIVIALVLEVFVAYMIRDNLSINIINLIHIFPPVAAWQAGV